jgi:hypothetical protein
MKTKMTTESTACVDAETLAAWFDGTLSTDEAGTVELHVSNCARCQAVMAVLAKTEPAMPASVPFWRRRPVGWLVPLTAAAAAAALVVWVASPTRPPSMPVDRVARTEPQPAQVAPAAPVVPEAPTAAAAQAPAIAAPAAPPSPATPTVSARPPASPPISSTPGTPGTPATAVTPATPEAPATQASPAGAAKAAPAPEPAAPAAAPTAPRTLQESVTVSGASPVVDVQRNSASALAADSVVSAAIVIVSPAPTAQTQAPGNAARAAGGRGGPLAGGAGRGGGLAGGAAAAAPPTTWRILPSGSVERSLTGGASWEQVAIYAPGAITGGVAPSASVCWLIGRGGLVLLTVDGGFERVSFPVTTDLASIRATDARQATVTSSDGRVFSTTDGGTSWR